MALVLQLKSVEGLKSKADRVVKVTFRGHCRVSKVVPKAKSIAYFGEAFDWPIARPIESDETLNICVYNHNKYVKDKQVGTFILVLQQVSVDGYLSLCEPLIDDRHRLIDARISFDVRYVSPDGKVGSWSNDEFEYPLIEQWPALSGSNLNEADDTEFNHDDRASSENFDTKSRDSRFTSEEGSVYSLSFEEGELESLHSLKRRRPDVPNVEEYKPRDYQICVKIIEAQQLVGLNIDPVVRVDVGGCREYTRIVQSSNCPFYDQYFVFDFHMTEKMLFDQMITLTVLHARNIPGREFMKAGKFLPGRTIGTFQCDTGTVYQAPGHQFFHKWAVLIDPKDLSDGPRGYLHCDLAVIGKGDVIKEPKSDNDDPSIEANLLLPEGLTGRQQASYSVMIFRGQDLPRTDTGVFANVKKVITMDTKAFVDPFVRVTFLGKTGRTKVHKSYFPLWMEKITFVDMFPPLCNRMKIELQDHDAVKNDVIGTHYIDLDQIMDSGRKEPNDSDWDGFRPTFGPCWVNMYGAPRKFQVMAGHGELNEGLGEGAAYRGRILLAIRTEVHNADQSGPSTVLHEKMRPSGKNEVGIRKEFLLFGSIFEANMIDKSFKEQDLQFELSIGVAGNHLDGRASSGVLPMASTNDEDQGLLEDEERQSMLAHCEVSEQTLGVTEPQKPILESDGLYASMPFHGNKPCLYVTAKFEDLRKRLFNSNMIRKIAKQLEESFESVQWMISREECGVEKKMKTMFGDLQSRCEQYLSHCQTFTHGAGAGRTPLDKKRLQLCQKSMDRICSLAHKFKKSIKKSNIKEMIREAKDLIKRLKHLATEPQHSMPDIFLWMIANKKRIAYYRIPPEEIIHSVIEDERGVHCSELQTVFLRRPGKKGLGQSGWNLQGKLQLYLWLGTSSKRKQSEYLQNLPPGYSLPKGYSNKDVVPPSNVTYRGDRQEIQSILPPSLLIYESHKYQLRAHIYQGRELIGSDESGLSDPFARIIIGGQCKSTQIKEQTVCPYWNEQLIFEDVVLYGKPESVQETQAPIVVEVFDYDKFGKNEFLGRALVTPRVKLNHEAYNPPKWPPPLQWWDIYRGSYKFGDILASFELLEVGDEPLPAVPSGAEGVQAIIPVHPIIQPKLSTYRVEILFWGVRDLKRLKLTTVDHPDVAFELGGKYITSTVIPDINKNMNFEEPLETFLVDLPDNEIYWPPANIRVIDHRHFGRTSLVGSHVINNISKYLYRPGGRRSKNRNQNSPDQSVNGSSILPSINGSVKTLPISPSPALQQKLSPTSPTDVVINMETNQNMSVAYSPTGPNGNAGGNIIDTNVQLGTPSFQTRPPSRTPSQNQFQSPNQLQTPNQPQPHPPNQPQPPGQAQPPNQSAVPGNEDSAKSCSAKVNNASKSGKEIEDLDWWSKYYVTKEDYRRMICRLMQKYLTMKELENLPDEAVKVIKMENEIEQTEKKKKKERTAEALEKHALLNAKEEIGELIEEKGNNKNKKNKSKGVSKIKGVVNKGFNRGKDEEMDDLIVDDEDANVGREFIARITYYDCELEEVPDFKGFSDFLHTYPLYRGKKSENEDEDDDQRKAGVFKGQVCFYKLADAEEDEQGKPKLRLSKRLPSPRPVDVLVRVYIIKGIGLHPTDPNGSSDPYMILKLGKRKEVNDSEHHKVKTLEPVFGTCFELEGTFPMDSTLKVQVMDHDVITSDDLIGETIIDLENRFYSKHRGSCGITKSYETFGYNAWRDPIKPTEILAKLCRDWNIDGPHYKLETVTVGKKKFQASAQVADESGEMKPSNEHLALEALKNWHDITEEGFKLVPEHVETRHLYKPDIPGVSQGRLEMWVDIFPKDMPAPGTPVDITPRQPQKYELRVIIWDTEEVKLEDLNVLTGEPSSDIFVRGYLYGRGVDDQQTDVHYRSLSGEGNFNWRLIYPFDYLKSEEMITRVTKDGLLAMTESEVKQPAKLTLQVWDADLVSADDFLGSVTFDLNRIPRPAKTVKKCSLKMLKKDVPTFSLFKNTHIRGWWPMVAKSSEEEDEELAKDGGFEIVGKVEAELFLLTAEEAEKSPAGHGREDPEGLPNPNRPDSSFLWFMNPLKTLRYVLWKNFKWTILKIFLFVAVVAIFVLFVYAMPGYTAKKIIGT